ncbi:MAG: DUF3052 family protein [Acidobacteriota bacterium]
MVGYSGTPLVKKLGIKDGSKIFLLDAPSDYLELVAPLPAKTQLVSQLTSDTDMVHIFSTSKVQLSKQLSVLQSKLKQDGVIWVSWPKKSAKVATDITENTIREVALPLGFVDIKVCAVSAIWSGLKLVIRKENRR